MSYVLAVPALVLWLLVVPMLTGLSVNFILPRERRTVGITFLLGFLLYIGVFEIIAISCMTRIVFDAFHYCCRWFIISSLLLAFLGLVRAVMLLVKGEKSYLTLFPGESHASAKDLMNPRSDPRLFKVDYSKESLIYWGIFFAILLFQMVMSVVMASFDGDDAYYVVESLLAQQAGVMNTILPYTGTSTSLDIRHALAVITMWIAFIAKQSGIHATIVSHSIIPLFIIPLVYLVYVEIGRIVFRGRQHILPVFMIVISMLLMFGNVSIYTPATFFLMRTWQGKALVSNMVFPLIFWMFLWMMEDVKKIKKSEPGRAVSAGKAGSSTSGTAVYDKTGAAFAGNPDTHRYMVMAERRRTWCPWVMLALINMLSGVCSSLGVIFGSGLIALLTLILMIYSRSLKRALLYAVGAFLCILPNLYYLAIYFSLFRG